jgi:hypothetical protein
MRRTDVYVKVELILKEKDDAQKIALEICRAIERIYEVRSTEVQNVIERE